MTGYKHHYSKAQEEFIEWYYSKHEDQELANFWFTNCTCIDSMLMYDDELRHALQ